MDSAGLAASRSACPRAAVARAIAGRSPRSRRTSIARRRCLSATSCRPAIDACEAASPARCSSSAVSVGSLVTRRACSKKRSAWSFAPRLDGPRRRRLEGDLGLAGECVGFGPLGRVRVRGQVMAGEGSRDLVGLQALEEARRGEMAALAVGLGERVVGDLTDQCLDEGVLAALRTSWVGLECQQLAADEPTQSRLQLGRIHPGHGRESRRRETLAKDRSVRTRGSGHPGRGCQGGSRSARSGFREQRGWSGRRQVGRSHRRSSAAPRPRASGPFRPRTTGCRPRGRRWPCAADAGRPGTSPARSSRMAPGSSGSR